MKKFGKKVYDGSNNIKKERMGTYICPVCHKKSRLIRQKGWGFQNILSVCESGHTCEITKELYEKYKPGDRIRLYESTFGKDAVIRLESYKEGIVTKSYPAIIDYQFDFKVDKCVMNGKEIKAPAWIIGHVWSGVNHSSTEAELLERAEEETYEQMELTI